MRAFIVPNGCSTVSRRWRVACGFASRRRMYAVERILVLSPCDAALGLGRAWRFAVTWSMLSPSSAADPVSLLVRVAIGQPLINWTAIDVLRGDVDKVLSAIATSAFAPEVIGLGGVTLMPASWHSGISGLLKYPRSATAAPVLAKPLRPLGHIRQLRAVQLLFVTS
jgi:hypothetical protein